MMRFANTLNGVLFTGLAYFPFSGTNIKSLKGPGTEGILSVSEERDASGLEVPWSCKSMPYLSNLEITPSKC